MPKETSDTQLQVTFDRLPTVDKVFIRCALNAVNDAKSAAQFDDLALARGKFRTPGPSPRRQAIKEYLRPQSHTDVAPEVLAAFKKQMNELTNEVLSEVRAHVFALVNTGRLPVEVLNEYADSFNLDVNLRERADTSSGMANIVQIRLFDSGLGAVSYAMLLLSRISSRERPAIFVCGQCQRIELIESTGGDHRDRFCSTKCRNRFSIRKKRSVDRVMELIDRKYRSNAGMNICRKIYVERHPIDNEQLLKLTIQAIEANRKRK
jgi:hypothetical protein